ncbi:MAG: DCC1-like thiol-disulfide oxidoreductase family protein [Planctomycetaceae bacterium]|jgi:predicted DCC family thiol-disulfide oxidoreductase YuxK|nr:DCC1-like thiol-disulfide oxidoreductase family protein [Planctomycetaceae bacterium]
MSITPHPILFFDGVCGLCNKSVDFVIFRDKRQQFQFAPLQSEAAASLLDSNDVQNLNTLILKTESGLFRRSSAVVRILWYLGGFWAFLGALLWIIPLPLRNLGYRAVSVSRYSLFGKKESCRIPTPSERARFLD